MEKTRLKKLDIKHTCPNCGYYFNTDTSYALHIYIVHEEDFINEVYWIRKLDYSIFVKVDALIKGKNIERW